VQVQTCRLSVALFQPDGSDWALANTPGKPAVMEGHVVLIGFGEAASTFARARNWGANAGAWDIVPERRQAAAALGLRLTQDAREALGGASLILSLVTADQALPAAQQYAPFIAPGALWCDMNSVAPQTKQAAARAVESAGAAYVDVAIMAPVQPAHLAVPLLIAGSAAGRAQKALSSLGFTHSAVAGTEIGQASAIKLIRSVMVKGIEALTDEMMRAAEAAGVADQVLASLDASEKPQGWAKRASYNRERMAAHGLRRAAEMEEAALTLTALGVEPVMTHGTIVRQRYAAKAGVTQ
jgi:3-hydroxyisobutyrate dehydrogenase-like beta-hydroxyacid dehydrogenase